MDARQEFPPKYWVVHDSATDDIIAVTLNKSKEWSINMFFQEDHGSSPAGDLYMDAFPDCGGYHKVDLIAWFSNHPTLKCELIEIKLV